MTEQKHLVYNYKENLKVEAENLLLNKFPSKILELNELLRKLNFQNVGLEQIHQELFNSDENIPANEPLTKRKLVMTGNKRSYIEASKLQTPKNSPCNKRIHDIIQTMKPHVVKFAEDANLLKMWITYLVPKFEEGNSFGLSLQEEILDVIQYAENIAHMFLGDINEYFVTRAKIISKVIKYPQIEDYKEAVKEVDEEKYLKLWLGFYEVRNSYCTLYDVLTKNLDKIKKPSSSYIETFY